MHFSARTPRRPVIRAYDALDPGALFRVGHGLLGRSQQAGQVLDLAGNDELRGLAVGNLLQGFQALDGQHLVGGGRVVQQADGIGQGLLNGQVGLLVDGLPLGYLAPVDLGVLMKSTEDRAVDYLSASCLRVLRYLALLAALLLPGLYVAMATYHQ